MGVIIVPYSVVKELVRRLKQNRLLDWEHALQMLLVTMIIWQCLMVTTIQVIV